MLILGRKVNQSILIGPDIKVMLTDMDCARSSVRLGIAAPSNLLVLREELVGVSTRPALFGPPHGIFRDGWLFRNSRGEISFSEDVPMWESLDTDCGYWRAPVLLTLGPVIAWTFPAEMDDRQCLVAVGPKVENR